MNITTVNPSTGEQIKSYPVLSNQEIDIIVDKMHNDFLMRKDKESVGDRKFIMQKVAELLVQRKKDFAELMAVEMGKPLAQGEAESEKCAWVCNYYADNAEKFLSDISVSTEYKKSIITNNPLGLILAIMPWNFPFWQVFRFAAPVIMAGNSVVLKHAPATMGCAFAIERIFIDAGFSEFTFKNFCVDVASVEYILSKKEIAGVTFTGSTNVGKQISMLAGKYLKKSVLELGGSDPYIILKDADLEDAVTSCVKARMINGGQSCIAGKRFIVEEELYDKFLELLIGKMKEYKFGNPIETSNNLGPMARKDLRDNLHNQVLSLVNSGANCLLGGFIPEREGFFYPPTVIADVNENMKVFYEETFGPVAIVIKAINEDHAIDLANKTNFGLGAAIFTKDENKGILYAKTELNAGSVFINDFVKSDPRLPFGGIKESGYGKELGEAGIKEFVNMKTVVLK